MNFYEAKFAREAKEHPTHWIIGYGRGGYRLIYIGVHRRCLMGMSATTLYAQVDAMRCRKGDALQVQSQDTYNRLAEGETETDASDREAAMADHMDKIAPALAQLHRAYYGRHTLLAVAEAVAVVTSAIEDAYSQYADDTADYYLERKQ